MAGSDFLSATAHPIGLPSGGGAALGALDPDVAALEQLRTSSTGWLAQSAGSGIGRSVYVDPTASLPGIGSLAQPFNSWAWVNWTPGTAYLQKGGTVSPFPLTLTGAGTAAAPILIGSYGDGAAVITSSVIFDNASHVALVGVTVAGSPLAGIMIEHGSNAIEIADDIVAYCGIGIDIADGAGGGNLIVGNTIVGNALFGVAVTDVGNTAGQETVIAGNMILDNGSHGIELDGNRFTVENNTVFANGLTVSGSSGIHVYATTARQGDGQYNVIRDNLVAGTVDGLGQDGNGIELDQFTADNIVTGNLTTGNDGAGIIIFDAAGNTVQNNTMIGDAVDSGHSHVLRGELVLASGFAASLATGNVLANNTAVALTRSAAAIVVDSATSACPNSIGGNIFANFAAGPVYSWAGATGSDLDQWNRKPKGGAADSFGF